MALEASEPSLTTGRDPQGASWIAAGGTPELGLAGLRRHLERTRSRLGLRALTVVVDDPDLGRQAFRAGSGDVELGGFGGGPGVRAEPPVAERELDAELLVGLCAASLRLEVLGGIGDTSGELALRRLPGVFAVELEDDGELTVCRVHVDDRAPDDVGRVAARALPGPGGPRLVVEVVRAGSPGPTAPPPATAPPPPSSAPPAPALAPEQAAHESPAFESPASDAPVTATPALETPSEEPIPELPGSAPLVPTIVDAEEITLLAVRSVPEDGEVEVHLGRGGTRAVGRAPLSRGLAGAAEAVLAAATQVGAFGHWRPSWVRTVETTADGHFVVAAALVDPDGEQHRHGIATGSSPIEAAARATVTALA